MEILGYFFLGNCLFGGWGLLIILGYFGCFSLVTWHFTKDSLVKPPIYQGILGRFGAVLLKPTLKKKILEKLAKKTRKSKTPRKRRTGKGVMQPHAS